MNGSVFFDTFEQFSERRTFTIENWRETHFCIYATGAGTEFTGPDINPFAFGKSNFSRSFVLFHDGSHKKIVAQQIFKEVSGIEIVTCGEIQKQRALHGYTIGFILPHTMQNIGREV